MLSKEPVSVIALQSSEWSYHTSLIPEMSKVKEIVLQLCLVDCYVLLNTITPLLYFPTTVTTSDLVEESPPPNPCPSLTVFSSKLFLWRKVVSKYSFITFSQVYSISFKLLLTLSPKCAGIFSIYFHFKILHVNLKCLEAVSSCSGYFQTIQGVWVGSLNLQAVCASHQVSSAV